MQHGKFDILYQDDDVVAINKPTGIKVHRGRADRGEESYVLQGLRDQIGRKLFPVHRLDRPTSGVLIFALNRWSARKLAKSFLRKAVEKIYLAVVRGYAEENGSIDEALTREDDHGRKTGDRLPAFTRFRRLSTAELCVPVGRYATGRYSLVEVLPETGRMHQIRRHFRRISHPIIGDRRYGDSRHNRFFREDIGVDRMLLAAIELRLPHPRTGEYLKLVATVDGPFRSALNHMGWMDAVPSHWVKGFRPADVNPAPESSGRAERGFFRADG